MTGYSDFIGLYPLQKTLRFELKPVGRTLENLKESGYFDDDFRRNDCYETVKELMNDYHRIFIDDCLSRSTIDWKPLETKILERKQSNNEATRKALRECLIAYKKEIEKLFTSDDRFKDMTKAELLKKYIWPEVKERGNEDELEAMAAYDRFAVYFQGYHENRANIYSAMKPKVSVPSRIVDDNFLKFVDNCQKYKYIKKEKPELIEQLAKNLELDNVDRFFDVSYYNDFLRQKGIDEYNYVLDGRVDETDHIQGLNVLLNLAHQKDPGFKRVLMSQLYKQILGNSQSRSFIPKQFESDDELKETVLGFCNGLIDTGITNRAQALFNNLLDYDIKNIFVSKTDLPKLSVKMFGSWDRIDGLLYDYYFRISGNDNTPKTRKTVEKRLKEDYFSLFDIVEAAKENGDFDITSFSDAIDAPCNSINNNRDLINDLKAGNIRDGSEDELDSSIRTLRSILDPIMDLRHITTLFSYDEGSEKDDEFYSELESLNKALAPVIPIFNKTRNYCTRKRYDVSKIKIKLGLPTLADGWDMNKEKDNGAVILRKNGQFYLAVMNPKNKVKFEMIGEDSHDNYEKMEYKYLPSPMKMFPKVFFSKKWMSEHPPSQHIVDGYEKKKMNAGNNFDLHFCHDLIDYYKDCMKKYGEWDVFNFQLSPTKNYNNMQDFYREIERQNYILSFRNISTSKVYDLVNENRLYLFQIRNKDFSEHSKGMPNMHTLYWLAAFSKENLENVRIKLNGEAELFFRNASISKPTVHKTGSTLIAKRDKENNPIPTHIYHELFKYKTGQISVLSEEAKQYEDSLVIGTAKYDIVKDRRYTQDKMFMHVPLTFNLRAEDQTNKINGKVIDKIRTDVNFSIIGLDRGERNLVYYSLIDREGRIKDQGSFNIIDGTDYERLLDQRQRGNIDARKNWNKAENIKEMKSGYISYIIRKLAQMIIDNNAIVVMEDLNYGFKHGRFKIEKQIYQKFETALITKLNYLAFKDKSDFESEGHVLSGYQLTSPITDVKNIGRQTGILFYVPASYTSKIDPTTGFANLFNMSAITTVESKKDFISKMKSITYDKDEDMFCFSFDYRDYQTNIEDSVNTWDVWTAGERFIYRKNDRDYERVVPTEIMKNCLNKAGIRLDGELKNKILVAESTVIKDVFYAFDLSTRMRVQNRDLDYIISPVRGPDGKFFRTGMKPEYPIDADANGAYNIALKGEMLMRAICSGKPDDKSLPVTTAADWFRFLEAELKIWKN